MPDDLPFEEFLKRLQAGDNDAARVVMDFLHRLLPRLRGRIGHRLRAKISPESVMQSTLRSFYRGLKDDRFQLDDFASLCGLLVVMTMRKCGRHIERFRTRGRDVGVEVVPASECADGPAGAGPPPDEEVMLNEVIAEVKSRLGTDLKRQIFELTLEGCTAPEISARLSRYERGVQRVRQEIRKRLVAALQIDTPPAPPLRRRP